MRRDDVPGGPADRERIEHMLTAGRAAMSFVARRERAHLDIDDMLRRALINTIQEIGEAAARVTDPGRARVPSLPWGRIVAMRHVLVHVYWGVDLEQLWKVAVEDVPVLVAALEAACAEWPRLDHERS